MALRARLLGAALLWLGLAAGPQGQAAAAGPAVASGDAALIERGRYLTVAGDCAACHSERGGPRFAGGPPLATPFGGVPAPNLTPDLQTGIGSWSFADFWRALHQGRGRRGELLYPVFPYTSYTKVDRDDALAIFAYLRSLPPVRRANRRPALGFPYDLRVLLAGWRALYFSEGEYRPDPSKSAQWNRGAYLVQGLGHCAECHDARNRLGGVPGAGGLAGGAIPMQNWYAPDLGTRQNGGLAGWSARDIVDLLKTGRCARGAAFGPMAEVVARSTQHLSDADLQAIAVYLAALPARPAADAAHSPIDASALADQGGGLYAKQCADCHGGDGKGVTGIYPPLDGNAAVSEPTGIDAIRMVLLGGFPPATAGNPRPYSMPPFAQQLSDSEVAALVTYIRQAWSNRAGPVSPEDVSRYRSTPAD